MSQRQTVIRDSASPWAACDPLTQCPCRRQPHKAAQITAQPASRPFIPASVCHHALQQLLPKAPSCLGCCYCVLLYESLLCSLPPPLPPSSFLSLAVCSSAPVNMKIKPMNRTALVVSWERPLTIYHPPILSYMVSYSWTRSEEAYEKTFHKTGEQSMVRSSPVQSIQD